MFWQIYKLELRNGFFLLRICVFVSDSGSLAGFYFFTDDSCHLMSCMLICISEIKCVLANI